ncbi:MAG: sigma-70 family RNA polymerase sigma factor [Pseudomonadota bacterium]
MTDLTDLVERCKAGDGLAFREMFRNHRADVARLALRMTGRPGELEDLVQEVFLQVYRSIKDFRGQSRFSTWLYRLTVNVVLMQRRAARSRRYCKPHRTTALAPMPVNCRTISWRARDAWRRFTAYSIA